MRELGVKWIDVAQGSKKSNSVFLTG